MRCYAIRGAVPVECNRAEEIIDATRELLERIVDVNGIDPEEIVSVTFSATEDLDAIAPARAARDMGWMYIPLLCVREMPTQGGMARVVRVMMYVNGDRIPSDVRHVYLGEAQALRPDLVAAGSAK